MTEGSSQLVELEFLRIEGCLQLVEILGDSRNLALLCLSVPNNTPLMVVC